MTILTTAFKYYNDIYIYLLFRKELDVRFVGYFDDTTTIYSISRVVFESNKVDIYTNSIGLLCKQAYLPEYIRYACMHNKVNKYIMGVLHDEWCMYYISSICLMYNICVYKKFLCNLEIADTNKFSKLSYNYNFVHTNKYLSNKRVKEFIKHLFSAAHSVCITSGGIFNVKNDNCDALGKSFTLSASVVGTRIFYVNCMSIRIIIDSTYAANYLLTKIHELMSMSQYTFALSHVFLKVTIIGAYNNSFTVGLKSRLSISTIVFKYDDVCKNNTVFKVS